MRRTDREITATEEILAIIDRCKVCRLGLVDADQPYVVPLNYGYSHNGGALTLYFHSAREGRKIDIISRNNKACFEIDCDHRLVEGERACDYGFIYSSVIGFGTVEFIENNDEKIIALNYLMKHQTGMDIHHDFGDMLARVAVYKLSVSEFTGKRKPLPDKPP